MSVTLPEPRSLSLPREPSFPPAARPARLPSRVAVAARGGCPCAPARDAAWGAPSREPQPALRDGVAGTPQATPHYVMVDQVRDKVRGIMAGPGAGGGAGPDADPVPPPLLSRPGWVAAALVVIAVNVMAVFPGAP